MGRSFEGHPLTCVCPECDEKTRLREQRITHDAPSSALPASSVAMGEMFDNALLHVPPRYSIGEDWSDD